MDHDEEVKFAGVKASSVQSGLRFVYDRDAGTFFTRTPTSWAKIGLFYCIYYSCLAGFFAGMLSIFLYGFTNDVEPRLVGDHSVLPQNPCMGFRPQPDEDKSLIKYDPENPKSYEKYVRAMEDYLTNPRGKKKIIPGEDVVVNYFRGQNETTFRQCPNEVPTDETKPCAFDLSSMPSVLDECVQMTNGTNATYGYESGQPCVVVKLNRILHFVPILKNDNKNNNESEIGHLEIRCEGLYAADKDNIGHLDYYPKAGVDLWHFPYVGQKNYLSPLVFVKFRNVTRNVLVQVVCRPTNAENIVRKKHSKGSGVVQFEIMIEAGKD